MDTNLAGGMIGIIFLVLCIGFLSFMQPAPHTASSHPFLDPNVAGAAESIELRDTGTFARTHK